MNEPGDLPIDDPLFALLESYVVSVDDIEGRAMAQIAAEDDRDSLRADVAALRTDVAALRAEMAEIKQILLARGDATVMPLPRTAAIDGTRGDRLLPYAPRDTTPIMLG